MRLLITILVFLLMGWLGGGTWFWVCKVKQLCNKGGGTHASISAPAAPVPEVEADEAEPARLSPVSVPEPVGNVSPLRIRYGEEVVMAFEDSWHFGKSSAQAYMPPAARRALDSLASLLKADPTKAIELTGLYAESEQNRSESTNLGLARADFIARQLVQRGIDEKRIIKSFELLPEAGLLNEQDTLLNGLNIRLIDAIAESTTDAPVPIPARDLYFSFNNTVLNMNPELRAYITRSIQYLNQHPDKKLRITGHTDNIGEPEVNLIIGRGRAEQVKQYFVEFGLSPDQIITDSKGASQPKASNDTREGRAQNRRVEIKIE